MNMQQIREIARDRGVRSGRMTKLQLVREIQKDEGNFACFGTASAGICDQTSCLWRPDCLSLSVKGRAA